MPSEELRTVLWTSVVVLTVNCKFRDRFTYSNGPIKRACSLQRFPRPEITWSGNKISFSLSYFPDYGNFFIEKHDGYTLEFRVHKSICLWHLVALPSPSLPVVTLTHQFIALVSIFTTYSMKPMLYYILSIKMTSRSLSNICMELRAAGE